MRPVAFGSFNGGRVPSATKFDGTIAKIDLVGRKLALVDDQPFAEVKHYDDFLARIGRGVWCATYWLPEADLARLGYGATVNRGCFVQTHLFHDRIMSMDTVTLDAGATLGPHSVILPAARIGEHGTVGPASLVMRGELVPVGSRWSGNPIGPWREVTVAAYSATTPHTKTR